MNLRRAAAAATGILLAATVLLAGGPTNAEDSRGGRTSTTAGRPVALRGAVGHVDNPAETRIQRRALGLPSGAGAGLTEWTPATASVIDGRGGSRALAARLTLEYSGAVSGADVTRVVHQVTRDLRRDRVAASRLLDVAEARCRRELTDQLARGFGRPT